jgi:hypothetical protein
MREARLVVWRYQSYLNYLMTESAEKRVNFRLAFVILVVSASFNLTLLFPLVQAEENAEG